MIQNPCFGNIGAGLNSDSTTCQLCDLSQVTLSLQVSDSPSFKWENGINNSNHSYSYYENQIIQVKYLGHNME